MDAERPSYYAIIPADVRYDDSIPANAKLLYGEISALVGAEGYCYASNVYFAEIYKMSQENIARLISKLEKAGHIKRSIIKDTTGQIIQRRLYLRVSLPEVQSPDFDVNTTHAGAEGGIDKKINTPLQKNQEGIDKKIKRTNTSNTVIEKENKKERATPLDNGQMESLFKSWITSVSAEWTRADKNGLYFALLGFYGPRDSKKKEPSRTAAAFTALSNRLSRFSGGSPAVMIDMLERATTAGWKSVYAINESPAAKPAGGGEEEIWLN